MYGIELTPGIAKEMNVQLVSLFEEGASDARGGGFAEGVDTDIMQFFYSGTSDSAENVYVYPAQSFAMHERPDGSDEREIDALDMYESRVRNIDYYRTMGVRLNDWNDDKIGRYKGVFYQLGEATALAHPRKVADTLRNAKTIVGYDGKALLATDHPRKPGTDEGTPWSNLLTQAGGLTVPNFGAAFEAMLAFPDEDGHTAGSVPTHLVVTPKNIGAGFDALSETPSTLQGGKNPWFGRGVKLAVAQDLVGVDEWGLIDNRSRMRKPFVFQSRESIQLRQITDPLSPIVFLQRKLLYSVDGRFNAGVGYPSKIIWSKKA